MEGNHFSKLSVEVLDKIFDYSLRHFQPDVLDHYQPPDHEPGAFRQWTPLPLVGVCKQWNEIIATSPRLWREWFLVVGQDVDNVDELSRKIKKLSALSRGSLITVQLFFSDSRTPVIWEDAQSSRFQLICHDIQLHSSRIRTLSLRGPEPLFHSLPTLVLPALERLEIYNTSPFGCWEDEDAIPDPIRIDAHNLTSLRLSAISPRHFKVPTANIRTLTLQHLLDFVSARILSTTPNVERVGLYNVLVDEFGPDSKDLLPPEIDLPQLRVLDWLQTESEPELEPTDLLNKISAPRLEHFRMTCDDIWEGDYFPAVHEWLNTTSSLKSFFLRTPATGPEDVLLAAWTLSSQALVVLYDGPDHPDSDPTPYPWYPEDFGDSLTTHVLQNAEWKRLFQVYYVLPPVPLVPSQT